jgi:hypothetical protein
VTANGWIYESYCTAPFDERGFALLASSSGDPSIVGDVLSLREDDIFAPSKPLSSSLSNISVS